MLLYTSHPYFLANNWLWCAWARLRSLVAICQQDLQRAAQRLGDVDQKLHKGQHGRPLQLWSAGLALTAPCRPQIPLGVSESCNFAGPWLLSPSLVPELDGVNEQLQNAERIDPDTLLTEEDRMRPLNIRKSYQIFCAGTFY